MLTESVAAEESTSTIARHTSINAAKWLFCLIVAGANAFIGFAIPPVVYEIPVELQSVDPNSPQVLKDKRAAADSVAYWNNVRFQFSWAGFFLGSVGITASLLSGLKRFGLGVATALVGLVSGLLAGVSGATLRVFLDKGTLLASLGDDLRPLVADVLVLAITSMILLVPIGFYIFFSGQNDAKQKSVSTVLAGFVAGMLTPVVVSMVTVFSLLAPEYNTELFPLLGLPVISLWFGLLLVMAFVASTMIGSRSVKAS